MLASSLVTLALALSTAAVGGHRHQHGGRILPPGPGAGWGFPNGNPDGYGWADYGTYLPLGADRTPDYNFPRNFALPPVQMFLPSYYNPYVTRGQRYIPYVGCGGAHPAGGPPSGPAVTPMHPYERSTGNRPLVPAPTYTGRTEASPEAPGSSGLVP